MNDSEPIAFSIGIMAHNEEANIGSLLDAVAAQQTRQAALSEIIVVASGCTDKTESIVRDRARKDARIRLVAQPVREGKAAALNHFLTEAREKIMVVCSADVLPESETLEQLVAVFANPEIGMATSHPVPVNDPATFMGFAAHLLWGLHHKINLRDFKAGELIAFRKIFDRISYRTSVDEASIEPLIRAAGFKMRYVPDAIVRTKGPETIADFLKQRRRIYAGHLAIRDSPGYSVSTLSSLRIIGLVVRNLDWRPRQFLWTWMVAALEAYGRFLGWRDYKNRRDHSIWDMAGTTKKLKPELCREQAAS